MSAEVEAYAPNWSMHTVGFQRQDPSRHATGYHIRDEPRFHDPQASWPPLQYGCRHAHTLIWQNMIYKMKAHNGTCEVGEENVKDTQR